jgi:1A family penicillin-binding protein
VWRLLQTDLGRARFLLGILIALTIVGVVWVGAQSYAVFKLRRGVGDTWFYTADGRRWFRLDEQRQDVPIASISPHLQHAFVAVEDHRFYRHVGVDPIALTRAVVRNLSSGSLEGGSTITQQLARTLFLSNRKSYGRKLREAVLSVLIEAQLSKEQILELYLNRIYLSAGLYGVEGMSRRMFDKGAKDLTLAESALIAGLARAPGAFSPWNNFEAAVERSHIVLQRMREERFITAEQEAAAKRARLQVRPYRSVHDGRHGYAKDFLRQQFHAAFGGDHPPDWRVNTTFSAELQDLAERAVAGGLQRHGIRDLQAALVVVDPESGNVLALVGGRDYKTSPFNRASRSKRQPGSAFKPFLFAAALERGYSPVSTLSGLAALPPQGEDEWSPQNASSGGADTLTLRAALVESDNRAATLLQQKVGSGRVLSVADRAGLPDLPNVPSLSLGTGLVTPLDLTTAFSMFPNGGYAVHARAITKVMDDDGGTALAVAVERDRVVSPQVAFQMVTMLGDVMDRGTASAARRLGVTFPAGGKTGTTDDFKDAWFVGFSPTLVAGVWVGFDQPKTIGAEAFGARYALPIWADFMKRATRVRRPGSFERPAGLQDEALCLISYLKPVEGCPLYTEYFKEGDDIPDRLCELHRGTIRQRVTRTIQGWAAEVGRKIKGIFR